MTGAKVDDQAIHAELQAICGLLSEVTRQMGPQTWQGGSAGRFTTDLQGHNRALGQMMLRVCAAVARANKLPMVLDPPQMPQVRPQPFSMFCGVEPDGLERLEAALRRAAEGLPSRAKRINSLLSVAGPVDVSTAQCGRTAAWCQEEAGRMRTRIRFAHASDRVNPALGGLGRALVWVPDVDRFGKSEMEQLGKLQAQAYAKQLQNPTDGSQKVLAEIGASLREHSKDTEYLRAFFGDVPPGSVGKLAHWLHQRQQHGSGVVLDGVDQKIVGDFGTALAASSRDRASRSAVQNALGAVGSDMPGQAMLVKFSDPKVKWDSHLLAELGKASLRWRQTYPSYEIAHRRYGGEPGMLFRDWGIHWNDDKAYQEYEPALNVLGRIKQQGDIAAARELAMATLEDKFVIKDPEKASGMTLLTQGTGTTYGSLLLAPDWPDKGAAAGSVIQLATTPEKGHEAEAARIAADVMKSVAWWNKEGRVAASKAMSGIDTSAWMAHSKQYNVEYGDGLRDGLLRMAEMHLSTLTGSRTYSGGPTVQTDPVNHQQYFAIDGDDARLFLRTFADDDRRMGELGIYAEHYRQEAFAWALRNPAMRQTATEQIGRLEGNIIYAYAQERLAREDITAEEYAQSKAKLTVVRDVAKLFLDKTPVFKYPGVGYAYDKSTESLLNKVKYQDFDKKVQEIQDKYANTADQLLVDLAYAYRLKAGRLPDAQLEALFHKASLTPEDRARLAEWSNTHVFISGEADKTGGNLVSDVETEIQKQAPPPKHAAPQN